MIIRRKQPLHLKVITDKEVDLIHETSLKILSEIGVKYPNRTILEKFDASGAKVNYESQVVKFPEILVYEALENLQKNFNETPPDAAGHIKLGDGNLQLSMDTTPDIVNLMSNTKCTGTIEDTLEGIAVANYLDNVRLATGYCLPTDVKAHASDVLCYELLWTYSKKPVSAWIYSSRSADYILEMAKLVAGGEEELKRKKLFTYFAEPISPLQYAPHTLEIIQKLSPYEIPIYLGPMVTMGGSGPVTIAGTLALHNAEILQGLILIYLCNPKQPVIYSMHCHSLDLMKMVTQYGAPEQALLAAGASQLAKKYGLPICGNVMLSDSNMLDYMAGFQEAATVTYALAAGWDMLGFMGFGSIGVVGNGVGHSLEKVIVQDEAISYLKRIISSFDVNEETLAYDVIKDIGIGGFFSSEEHTVKHMKNEIWRNKGIFKNYDYSQWSTAGAESVTDRAHAKLKQIKEESLPLKPRLPGKTIDAISNLTRSAMNERRE